MKSFVELITQYLTSFSSYINPLLYWGHWLFLSLLIINLVWMALWHAFDQDSFSHAMPIFIRKFFIISVFYTIMIHPDWLMQLLQTAEFMGGTLTKISLTPQAILSSGIQLSNKIMVPLAGGNLLTGGSGFIVALLVALLVLFVFLSVTLDLLAVLITTTFLISMASFFLGLVPQSESVGRQTLNKILSNCMKLFGLYLVIGIGLHGLKRLTAIIPMQYTQLDPYVWISAIVLLFWILSKQLPRHLSDIMAKFLDIIPPNTHVTNLPSSNQALQTTQYSNAEKNDTLIFPALTQSDNKMNAHSTFIKTTIPTGQLSDQFSQIVRKLATRSKMTLHPKNTHNKRPKIYN